MKKRMVAYLTWMDCFLKEPPDGVDYEEELWKHLLQIEFFMHERLVHLIVTVLFAILTFGTILYAAALPSLGVFLLIVALLCLLVPYILHYYLLENGVQKMYEQYDALLRLCERKRRESEEKSSAVVA